MSFRGASSTEIAIAATPATAPSDAELMRGVQQGDRDAFRALVERHRHALVAYLTAVARDRDRAEEIAQDAFVRLFERSARYREQGRFLAYLFRIGTNLLRGEERKARRREILLRTFSRSELRFSPNGHGRDGSPQEELLRGEAGERVSRALAALPLRYRSPLILREIEGWSYQDIAETLSCREGTVKSRIHRGRAELRRLLAPYWNGGRT